MKLDACDPWFVDSLYAGIDDLAAFDDYLAGKYGSLDDHYHFGEDMHAWLSGR